MKNLKQLLQLSIMIIISLFMVKCEVESFDELNEQSILKSAQITEDFNPDNAVLAFGPEKFERSTNAPEVFSFNLSLEEFEFLQDTFVIYIKNGDADSNFRINSGILMVNGNQIFRPNDFKNKNDLLIGLINEDEEISVELELRGKPGDFLTLSIFGQEHKQSSIIYTEKAFPGQSGEIVEVMFNNSLIECELINGMYVYQGDIILTDKQINSSILKSAAIGEKIRRWENKTVYYTINENAPRQRKIKRAIKHWENETSIEFIERTDEPNYVEFIESEGCWSNLGMLTGRQEIGVADWAEKGTMIHEIGHTLGLIHEHSRTKRDDFIIVDENNIKPSKLHNFNVHPNSVNSTDFDFGSIMIYSAYNSFAIDDELPTMTKLDGSTWKAQRKELSDTDIEFIEFIYTETPDNYYGDFAITTETYPDNCDRDEIIQGVFGDDYRVADWNDLVKFHNTVDDITVLMDGLGLTDYHSSAAVNWNGRPNWSASPRRYFFISRHNHSKPGSYLAHRNIDNYSVSLGSWWFSGRKIIAVKKSF